MERRTDAHRRHDERRASAVPESGQRRVQNLRRYAYNSLLSSFFLSRMDRKFIQSLTFNVILIILIITHTSQALVTGKRSYIESCCCCVCVCVCFHCFSSGVKIKRKREREDAWIVEFWSTTLGKNSFCCVSVECETARRSFVRNVDVAPFHHLSSSSLL